MGDETTVALNRRARHDFTIDETFEAGIVLTGTEIKSLRAGKANLSNAYARIERGEAWLVGADIAPFEGGNRYNHEPKRTRKLLLHRSEIDELLGQDEGQGPDRSSRSGSTSTRRAGPRSSSGSRAASSSTTAAATSPSATRDGTSRASWPTPSAAGRGVDARRSPVGSRIGPVIEAVDAHAAGEPGRVIVGGVSGVAGAHDVRGDDLAPGAPRRPAPADAARAARLPGRQLQPHPARRGDPGGGRRLRDHGAGRVPGDVRHEHDVRRDRPARDRDAADDRAASPS